MSTIGLYFAGLSAEQTNALRARLNRLAGSLGYTAQGGPTAGEGNVAALLQAIDAGEVAVVRQLPEKQDTNSLDREKLAGKVITIRMPDNTPQWTIAWLREEARMQLQDRYPSPAMAETLTAIADALLEATYVAYNDEE